MSPGSSILFWLPIMGRLPQPVPLRRTFPESLQANWGKKSNRPNKGYPDGRLLATQASEGDEVCLQSILVVFYTDPLKVK